jgi:hypothetical protein
MFEKISIGIKTFLRDLPLFVCLDGLEANFPGASIIVADCGTFEKDKKRSLYYSLVRCGHTVIWLPFDSGFGRMSNAIVGVLDSPYLLVGSDDFIFNEAAASGVERLQEVLDNCPDVDIASGRVNNRPYEFYLDIKDGVVVEIPIQWQLDPWTVDADLTVNYSLIRREVFKRVRWDNDVRIGGGEHGSFFYDCKLAGVKTVYVPGVNINEQQIRNSPEYNTFRNRARSAERPCFQKRGIVKYVLGSGKVDYDATTIH